MSLLGVGAANIDLILEKTDFNIGESVNGYFSIVGGTIEQKIRRIECDLVLKDRKTKSEHIIESFTMYSTKSIASTEMNKIPFSFHLPKNIRCSDENISYRFKTKMYFQEGVKSEDQDFIRIHG
jgi:sporulation-control protein